MKKCEICDREIDDKSNSQSKKYCSRKCKSKAHYNRHKETYKENARKWEKENPEKRKVIAKKACDKFRKEKPERFNELMRKHYQKNKDKHRARCVINTIIKGYGSWKPHPNLIPNKFCKKCGSKDNLEIHHEEYPTKIRDIKQSIKENKIYFLCRNCHGRRKSHNH